MLSSACMFLKCLFFWENCVLGIMSWFVELICWNYVTSTNSSKSCVHKEKLLILNSIACTILLTFYICFAFFLKDKRHPGQPKPRLFTVGRLDVATTGLIIVTNDGIDDIFFYNTKAHYLWPH